VNVPLGGVLSPALGLALGHNRSCQKNSDTLLRENGNRDIARNQANGRPDRTPPPKPEIHTSYPPPLLKEDLSCKLLGHENHRRKQSRAPRSGMTAEVRLRENSFSNEEGLGLRGKLIDKRKKLTGGLRRVPITHLEHLRKKMRDEVHG